MARLFAPPVFFVLALMPVTSQPGQAMPAGARPTSQGAPCDDLLYSGGHYDVGSQPFSVAMGDVDGDGRLDVVTADLGSGSITVLQNVGSGGFVRQPSIELDGTSASVALGDFDGDGDLDLAAANWILGKVSVILNEGGGVFTAQADYLAGSNPFSVTAGDLDGDGDLDLVATNRSSDSISVLLNEGAEGFASQEYAVEDNPFSTALADLDGDEDLDLAVANGGSSSVSILLNGGNGTFVLQGSVAVGANPNSVVCGDFDGDGDLDIATANRNSNSVSILLNNGGAFSSTQPRIQVGLSPRSIAVGDLDNDGALDIATANHASGDLSVLLNEGAGTFSEYLTYDVEQGPFAVDVGDLDGDGYLDLAVANSSSNSASVLLNNGPCPTGVPIPSSRPPHTLVAGDMDGDARLDVVALNEDSDELTIFLDTGGQGPDRGLAESASVLTQGTPTAAVLGDVDGDGDQDIVVGVTNASGCGGMYGVQAFLSDGGGGLNAMEADVLSFEAADFALADIDHDGDLDAVAANRTTGGGCPTHGLSLLINDGFGAFVEHPLPLPAVVAVALDDFDRDGDVDLVAAESAGAVSIWLGDGQGGFAPAGLAVEGGTGRAPTDILLHDADRDGDLDLLVTFAGVDELWLLLGNGHGVFEYSDKQGTPSEPFAVRLQDYAESNAPQILSRGAVVLCPETEQLAYFGFSAGMLTTRPGVSVSSPWDLVVGGFDGNGTDDVLVSSPGQSALLLVPNGNVPEGTYYGGYRFGAGDASFVDNVELNDPGHQAGAAPVVPFDDPDAALGPPDSLGAVGPSTVSLGEGGRIVLSATESRFSQDAIVFVAGVPPELASVAARPSNTTSRTLLLEAGYLPDAEGFFPIGQLLGTITRFLFGDIFRVSAPFGALRFDAIAIEDVAGANAPVGASVGVDIDAVGAIHAFSPLPDLVVSGVAAPTAANAGENVTVSWALSNHGDVDLAAGFWTVRILFSSEPDGADQSLVASFPYNGSIARDATLDQMYTFTAPGGASVPEEFYVWVRVDFDDGVYGFNNELRAPQSLTVYPPLRPDLVVEIVEAPSSAVAGTPIDVTYRVTNQGSGATTVPYWYDAFRLVSDQGQPLSGNFLGSFANPSYLQVGESYQREVSLTIPSTVTGTRYISCWTDNSHQVHESDESNNYMVSVGLDVMPPILPDLAVQDVRFVAPGDSCEGVAPRVGLSGQLLGVCWEDVNQGPVPTTGGGWYDGVYLSRDPTSQILLEDIPLNTVPSFGAALAPGGSRTLSAEVLLPLEPPGDPEQPYFLKVLSDFYGGVAESEEGNNVAVSLASFTMVQSVTPDLHLTAIERIDEGPALAGHQVTVRWTVVDEGFADWDTNFSWTDRLYLSQDEIPEPSESVHIAWQSASFVEGGCTCEDPTDPGSSVPCDCWIGSSYDKTATIRLPNDLAPGVWNLIVEVDANGTVFEYVNEGGVNVGEDNNNGVLPLQVQVVPTNLVPTVLEPLPASGAAGMPLALHMRVDNTGSAPTPVGTWFDTVWLSTDDTLGGGDRIVASRYHSGVLEAGGGYEVVLSGNVPLVDAGPYHLLFETDSSRQVWELGGEGDNVQAVEFLVTPEAADLVVANLDVPRSAEAGEPLTVTWTVLNQGTLATNASYWADRVYLSEDAVLGGGDILLGTRNRNSALGAGHSYEATRSFTLPLGISGFYYVIVSADANQRVFEHDDENNFALRRMPISVTALEPADLVVSSVVVPADHYSGQPLEVHWTVRNDGPGDTNEEDWQDSFYLSANQTLEPGDLFLGTYRHEGPLLAGSSEPLDHEFELPLGVSGALFVLVRTNADGRVYEAGATGNNVGASGTFDGGSGGGGSTGIVQVVIPEDCNLRVTHVDISRDVMLGGMMEVSWTTTNLAGGSANGGWTDNLYLSQDDQLGVDDVLLEQVSVHPGTLPVGMTHVETRTFEVPGVVPDQYRVLVQSDARNQIPETDESDNRLASTPVPVSAIVIEAGDVLTPALSVNQAFYAELLPPISPSTVDIRFESASVWTELYVAEGYVPSPGRYDYAFDSPGASEQIVTIPLTAGNSYYLLARVTSGVLGSIHNTTLSASIVPFELSSVEPPTIGAGLATIRLAGSMLDTLQGVELRNQDTLQVYTAAEVGVVSPIAALATFDLGFASLGLYDVIATATDAGETGLIGAIVVEPPTAPTAQLVLEVDPSVREGAMGTGLARIRNAGNVDLARAIFVLGKENQDEIEVSVPELDQMGLESDDILQSLVLLSEDLGPGQEASVTLDYGVAAGFNSPAVLFAISGRALAPVEEASVLLARSSELLRQAVLGDPNSNDGLLDLAGDPAAWSGALGANLPPDTSGLHTPGTLPLTGRQLLQSLGDAACLDLAAIDQVQPTSIDAAVPMLACELLDGFGFDCAHLVPGPGDEGLDVAQATAVAGSVAPVRIALCETPTSFDPNAKNGPSGFGSEQMISTARPVRYRIYFENLVDAVAPASRVVIRDELPPELLTSSFRATRIGFGDTVRVLPPNTISYQHTIDATDDHNVLVQVTIAVNATSREALWIFQSLDPETGQPIADGLRGFLPPNDDDGAGEGFVEFVGSASGSVLTGARPRNVARIRFDSNPEIITDETANTFDAEAPESALNPVDPIVGGNELQVEVSGEDPEGGSGVASYTVYVAKDGGAFVPVATDVQAGMVTFPAEPGSIYEAYSVGVDRTGNEEAAPPQGGPGIVTLTVPSDCNGNGVSDAVDVANGTSVDCNGNSIPDECDIAEGTSLDLDSTGVPDECECQVVSSCMMEPGSSALGVTMTARGSASLSENDLRLVVTGARPHSPGVFFYGTPVGSVWPFEGSACLGVESMIRLHGSITDETGTAVLPLDLQSGPIVRGDGGVKAGQSRVFQFLYRDHGPALSQGLLIRFCL